MEEITRNEVWFGYDDLETCEDSITINFPGVIVKTSSVWSSYMDNKHENEYEVNFQTEHRGGRSKELPTWMEIVNYPGLEPYIDEPDCLPGFTFSYEGDVVTLREFMKKYVFGGLIEKENVINPYLEDLDFSTATQEDIDRFWKWEEEYHNSKIKDSHLQ